MLLQDLRSVLHLLYAIYDTSAQFTSARLMIPGGVSVWLAWLEHWLDSWLDGVLHGRQHYWLDGLLADWQDGWRDG